MPLVITQDEVGQDGKHRTTRGALDAPNGDSTQAHTDIRGVARQASTSTTRGLVFELKAKGQEKGEHAFDKGLVVTQQLHVDGFVVKIDGDGPVFTGLAGCGSHGHSQVSWSRQLVTKHEGNASSRGSVTASRLHH